MGRGRQHLSMALGICLVALLALPALATATPTWEPSASVSADLDGRAIAVSAIPDWYCHDLDYPRIHCFKSPLELEHALSAHHQPIRTAQFAAPLTSAVPYLNVYVDANFSGGYTAISKAYDDLGAIGWNDKISSFKALNGIAGHFATDIYNSGGYDYFAPYQQTTYVGDAWNDQFSSVYPW